MKEPESLASSLHVLVLITGRTYIITHEQCVKIVQAQNSGQVKTVSIGDCPITLHQIADMPTLDVYRSQMKTKLAMQGQRMCRRCGAVLAMQDRCACIERGELTDVGKAAKVNPVLHQYLVGNGMKQLLLPPVEPAMLPEAPPTPKEREQMRAIQAAKDRFLGKTSRPFEPLPDCSVCKNERRYMFQGAMVKCDCTLPSRNVSRKHLEQAEQSGTLKNVSPLA